MTGWREGLFAASEPKKPTPPIPKPIPPAHLSNVMHVDQFGNRTGDLMKTKAGARPYYRKGDFGILKTLDADGWWLVDFNGHGNRKVHKEGCWHVPASDVEKQSKGG